MTNLRNEIKTQLEEIKKELETKTYTEVIKMGIDHLGIRNHYEEMEIGEEVSNSYEWNFEKDNSTYYDDDPEEIDTCAIIVPTDEHNSNMEYWYDVDLDLVVDNIIEKLKYTAKTYVSDTGVNKYYLIAGSSLECRNSLDDDFEGRYEDAKVIMDLTSYIEK